MLEIVLTREDANSESALLVEWLAADGETVRKGQPVCVIETSKSAIEIEAPGAGILRHLVEDGRDVPIGSRIAAVAADAREAAEADRLRAQAGGGEAPPPGVPRATRKAAELAERHGVDLSSIAKSGFITAEDVEAAIAARDRGTSGPLGALSLVAVSLPATLDLDPSDGALDPAFVERLRAEPDAIRALPEGEKLDLYRSHGARLGEGVRLGEGSLIVSPRVVLEDGVELGAAATARCDEAFCVGSLTRFGARLEVSCRRVFVGAAGYVCDAVTIGGGGGHDPQAAFVAGDLLFVGDEAFLNPCRPIVIGREVFVTMRSALVTHNVGHSLLEGFENRFAPIVLEDRCQVGIAAVVYAGSRVGAEAIIASNSYVVADVPPGKLAAGVPARVVGNARHPLGRPRQIELAVRMTEELQELVTLRGHDVSTLEGGEGFLVRHGDRTSAVLFADRLDHSFEPPRVDGETVALTLELTGDPPPGVAVFELLERRAHGTDGPVADSVREFCRKRGIRFEPGPWRYGSGGLV